MQTDATSAKEAALREQWLHLNRGWTYVFLNDTAAVAFLETLGKAYTDAFHKLLPGAMKADFLRLAWLYKHGGAYADVDNQPGSLEEFTGLADILIPKSWGPPEDCVGHLYNAFMMVRPGSKFIKRALKTALKRIRSSWKDSCGNCELTCYGIAGPTLLGEEFCRALPLIMSKVPERIKEPCTFTGGSVQGKGCTALINTTMAIDTGESIHILEEHGPDVTRKLYYLPWATYPAMCWAGRIYRGEEPPPELPT